MRTHLQPQITEFIKLKCAKEGKQRCFTVIGIQAQCVGLPKGGLCMLFLYSHYFFFYPCQLHISETILCNNWRRNLVFMAAGFENWNGSLSFSHNICSPSPQNEHLTTKKTLFSYGTIWFFFPRAQPSPVYTDAVDGRRRKPLTSK